MSEMIEIAGEANKRRRAMEAERAQAERANIERKAELDRAAANEAYDKQEVSKDKDRQVKIKVAELNAVGRASDKQSDQAAFAAIEETANERVFSEEQFRHKQDMDKSEFRLKEAESQERMRQAAANIKSKAKEIEEKVRDRKSREYIATINKN